MDKSCERKFLSLIEHSLATAKDLLVIQTLLETTAEVMVAVDVTSELFLFCLLLLIDQLDHPNLIVRINASRLINRSCYIHVKGGFATLLSRTTHIQKELFDHLSARLTSRPNVVGEFAEAVLGFETEELVKKMVHVVLPKLLVYWQENAEAASTLNELAKLLDTDVVPLIVTLNIPLVHTWVVSKALHCSPTRFIELMLVNMKVASSLAYVLELVHTTGIGNVHVLRLFLGSFDRRQSCGIGCCNRSVNSLINLV